MSGLQERVSTGNANRVPAGDDAEGKAATGIGRWEHFAHMADIGVRGIGPSREIAFVQAAQALCAAITEPELVRAAILFEVDCKANEDELLLVDWLNALIGEMSEHRLIFSSLTSASPAVICVAKPGAKWSTLGGTTPRLRRRGPR